MVSDDGLVTTDTGWSEIRDDGRLGTGGLDATCDGRLEIADDEFADWR